MKKHIAFFAALLMIPSCAVSAEKPEGHIKSYDGSTAVWFDTDGDEYITYTTDGSRPTKASAAYDGGRIYMTHSGSVKLRVSSDGKAKIYSYRVNVMEKDIIKPKALQQGDTIGIIAPGKYIDGDISEAVAYIENMGYNVKLGETCSLRNGAFAGTPEQRAADVEKFFADDEVDAILCLRGGSGCIDILPLLDYDMISQHPKMLIGFSDITVLHSALFRKCGFVTIHGSMLSNFAGFVGEPSEYTVSQFADGVSGRLTDVTLPEDKKLTALCRGTAQGRLVGGNLTRMCELIGTPYQIDARGNILVIEDTHESAESIERMLEKLKKSGIIDECSGIIFGEFTDSVDSDGRSWQDVLAEFAQDTGKPCIMGLPAGHDCDNMFLPLGIRAEITADENGAAIHLLESAFE